MVALLLNLMGEESWPTVTLRKCLQIRVDHQIMCTKELVHTKSNWTLHRPSLNLSNMTWLLATIQQSFIIKSRLTKNNNRALMLQHSRLVEVHKKDISTYNTHNNMQNMNQPNNHQRSSLTLISHPLCIHLPRHRARSIMQVKERETVAFIPWTHSQ